MSDSRQFLIPVSRLLIIQGYVGRLTLLAAPLNEMRPCDGLKLYTPLNAAGIATEPPDRHEQ